MGTMADEKTAENREIEALVSQEQKVASAPPPSVADQEPTPDANIPKPASEFAEDPATTAVQNAAQAALREAEIMLEEARASGADANALSQCEALVAQARNLVRQSLNARGATAQSLMTSIGTLQASVQAEEGAAIQHTASGAVLVAAQKAAAEKTSVLPNIFRSKPVEPYDPNEIVVTASRHAMDAAKRMENMAAADHDTTIDRDMHQDFADHGPKVTADGHAVLRKGKREVIGPDPSAKAKSINRAAQIAASVGAFGMDAKAAKTSANLANQAMNGKTQAEREAATSEMLDAVDRRVLGRTFVGQEIDDSLDKLDKMGYTSKIGGIGSSITGLRTSDVMAQLTKNGWASDRWTFFHSNKENSEWSDNIRKRLDFNHDGQLSTEEIKFGLDHTKTSYDIHHAAEVVRKKADDLADKVEDIAFSKTKLGKQVQGMAASFQAYNRVFDKDKDGASELHEIVKTLHDKGIKEIKDMNGDHKIDIQDVKIMFNGQKAAHDPHAKAPAHAPVTPKGAPAASQHKAPAHH